MAIDTDLEQPGGPQTRPNKPAEGASWPGEVPGPDEVAGTLPQPAPSDTGLPAGVHPMDPSGPESFTEAQEVPSSAKQTTRRPFATDNGQAFGVYERAAQEWRATTVVVNANQGGTSGVVGRQRGRKSVTIWVPSQLVVGGALVTPANGIMFAATEGELQGGGGAYLAVGDSVTIASEAAVAVGLPPGAAVAYCQYLDLYNPPGGGIIGAT